MTRVLLTFTGFHDPFAKSLIGQVDQPGPVLALIADQQFDRVILFSTPKTELITVQTQDEIHKINPGTATEIRDVPIDDPTDYAAILKHLRRHIHDIMDVQADAHFAIAVASGTPQMHAAWVLLAASGEIPATILHVRPPRFVTADRPLVSEVDLSADDFPTVRTRVASTYAAPDVTPAIDVAVRQLGIVGEHRAIITALETATVLADSNVPILIRGETGTGKELFARLVHRLSGRPTEQFVAVNCAAIPEDLVESILFGHKKGSFTGAVSDQKGKFQIADGGTLFLDELAELPLSSQAKLLRVLQDGVVDSVGSTKPYKVNVRVVAATNQNIGMAIKNGAFREDLFYRLQVGELVLPPLRERRSDVPVLALHILDRVNASLRSPKRLSQNALARLQTHTWPGNVRDLANVIERSVRLCRSNILEAEDLLISDPVMHADPLSALPEPEIGFSLDGFLGSARKQLILRAIELARGNQSEAARLLGVTPQAVHKFLKQTDDYNPG
jgi:DNA-binding NtrC family response regulator